MKTLLITPLVRISLSLMVLTVAMLLVADMLGLLPDTRHAEIQSRKVVAESLAIQLSTEISHERLSGSEEIIRAMVERNESILSAALRSAEDALLAEFGEHAKHWTLKADDKSSPTQIRVPIFQGQRHWGTVEIAFGELGGASGILSLQSSLLNLILFTACFGFVAYLLFLKRALRELNPDEVIPDRVSKALNTLTEGLLIVDRKGHIVFANAAFADRMHALPRQLLGRRLSDLAWLTATDDKALALPWNSVLAHNSSSASATLKLKNGSGRTYTFNAKASPIAATEGRLRGAIVTLNDITEIELKNEELQRTLLSLEQSQDEISRQNQELKVLATRDPLTGALNRRSLIQGLNTLFAEAKAEGSNLSCIMIDIDHFKSVNDSFGHVIGDEGIKLVAEVLTKCSRPIDLVGRLGGEEFFVVLPDTAIDKAAIVAERMRLAIGNGRTANFPPDLRITASFGVASLSEAPENALELLDRSDKALYAAKESGRNRVVNWNHSLERDLADGTLPDAGGQAAAQTQPTEQGPADRAAPQVEGDRPAQPPAIATEGALLPSSVAPHSPSLNPEPSERLYSLVLLDRTEQGIKRAQREDSQVAVMLMNFDALQRASDMLGIATAEKLAREIITRLKQHLRPTDTVVMCEEDDLFFNISRHGSHEIILLLNDLEQTGIATRILHRIFTALKEPVKIETYEFYLTTEIGISLFPHDGEDADTLIRNASIAMRAAKQEDGTNVFRFYAKDTNLLANKQLKLEAELHWAVQHDELCVYYQPKVDLFSGEIRGMEALIRWQHPRLGLVPPDEFIPLAEQLGFIEEISHWVINSVCQQLIFWHREQQHPIKVAVNISPIEFRNPDFAENLIAIVKEYDLPAGAIELEITETAVLQNIEAATQALLKLKDAGFSISLDDFGTGYSSLSYLKKFPIDKVKIDRSFISDFLESSDDANLVSAIIALSHSLGKRVIAEGVETEEQLRFLQDLHCDEVQGYLVSRPLSVEETKYLFADAGRLRRMIQESRINAGLTTGQWLGPVTGMIGVLNPRLATLSVGDDDR
jgi:diguanylate cyclase (GGDEF)-like protein/PAS domain S-box-containing protein